MFGRIGLLSLLLFSLHATDLQAGGPCSGVRGGCHRSDYYSPQSYSPIYIAPEPKPKKTYRTKAKTYARTRTWGGTMSASKDSPEDIARYAPAGRSTNSSNSDGFAADINNVGGDFPTTRVAKQPKIVTFNEVHADRSSIDRARIRMAFAAQAKKKPRTVKSYRFHFLSGKDRVVQDYRREDGNYVLTLDNGTEDVIARSEVERVKVDVSSAADLPFEPKDNLLPTKGTVSAVLTGGTLLVNGDMVRMIGVDAPDVRSTNEVVREFGKESQNFMTKLARGKSVLLSYEEFNEPFGHRNADGHILAYVALDSDSLDCNAEAIKNGYAHADAAMPFARLLNYEALEQAARADELGLWEKKVNSRAASDDDH